MLFPRLLLLLASISVLGLVSGQPSLPTDEVEALTVIGRSLGKRDWNFDVDPCGGLSGWGDPNPYEEAMKSTVTCNCTFANNTICHVVSIILKAQNLNGSIPAELTSLPFLQEIDLSRNYLNGTIPKSWGSMNLVNISLMGNRITGPIPQELGNITTLAILTLEFNQLSGPIPTELGKLTQLEALLLSSNNLSGEIPPSLESLTTLRNFSISDNNFTGQIPNFIQNWTNLQKLEIQASGLRGPIPPGIAFLTKLIDLRISDLSGNDSNFPPLRSITNLNKLILRSCNITGELPGYVGDMTTLKVLDLSFNKLSGPIPESFSKQTKTDYIYLTGNSLSGPLPLWMLADGQNIDLSYNNLTTDDMDNCRPRYLNLFASSRGHTSGVASCLRRVGCPKRYSSLYINCGGKPVNSKRTTYEEDADSGGPTDFYGRNNWRVSSTGHFVDTLRATEAFTNATSSSISGENPQLYQDARLSPLSLTYYAFCMFNGNYTVNLHFAEIMLTNDSTFSSLGRRLFDVYIQGKRVWKDFNIANEAGGVNVGIKRNFTAVVNDSTLDIRLYWAGKGTSGLTVRGVYGPLISAISVEPNFTPPSENGKSIPAGAIAGIVVAVLCTVVLVLAFLWWKGCLGRKYAAKRDLKGVDLTTGSFTLRQIKAATNNFDPANKIGEGGFGPVYKGHLLDGSIIAVKQLSSKSKQGNREFVNEIGMISALQHPHLVKLYGCCIEGNQLLLVYEYMENNSLARVLFGSEEQRKHLDWPMRHKISIDIARGLAYLHEESRLKIVHRDIKATNVLLDKDFVAKISDFGLAKLDEEDNTHISTRVAGTYGYMAPEYAMRGYLTDKADVYSFGVVLLEIVSGRSNTSLRTKDNSFYLLDWANSLKENGSLLDLVDPRLDSNFNKKEVIMAINLALECTNAVAAERPSMSTVVSVLEGKDGDASYVSDQGVSNGKLNPKNISVDYSEGQITEVSVPWTASSASTGDLYPISVNTEYWQKRDT